MKKKILKFQSIVLILLLVYANIAKTQNIFPATGSAGIGTVTPNATALLEMKSTTQGLLIPRMTQVDRDAILTPATGLMIYQTTATTGFYYYTGTAWVQVSTGKANTNLGNLSVVTAINSSLLPKINNAIDLGSALNRWKDVNLYNLKFNDGSIQTTAYTPYVSGTGISIASNTINSVWTQNGNNIYNNNAGNIGVGLNNPTHSKLEVVGSVGSAVAMFGSNQFGVTIGANNPEIGFNYFYNGGTKTIKAGYAAAVGMSPGNGDIYFGNFNGNQSSADYGAIAGYQTVMTIKQNGKIGIGTTSPSEKIHITGADAGLRINAAFINTPGTTRDLVLNAGRGQVSTSQTSGTLFLQVDGSDAGGSLFAGAVAIGTTTPATGYKLSVNGSIMCTEMKVQAKANWPDYVFDANYKLTPLCDLKATITQLKHLPGIPSSAEVTANNGIEVGDMQAKLLQKVEELTLYILKQQEEIDALKADRKAFYRKSR